MPADIPLTPEAAAVVAAFDAVMGIDENTGLFEDSRHALVAALREVADRVAPSDKAEPRNNLPALIECQQIRREIIAIADSIENAITYAENQSNGH